MKVTVIKRFRDRLSDDVRERGQILELNEDRATELSNKGFVSVLSDAQNPVANPPVQTTKPEKSSKKKK
ncbi:hypothetical protein [Chitinophaga sp.]|uniref:hypothetical protein n=1 Tax=Chitinophaga sp. TaxID=1869181 RepID=UPI0031D0E375